MNSGIFYEFVEATSFFEKNPQRLSIGEVKVGVNYVMIVSTNAGLWGYNLGDTVQFTSTNPYRLIVSGRIKHFISAFGEHVIGNEVEQAIEWSMKTHHFSISEFTVAPQIETKEGELPYHEWLVEFEIEPEDLQKVASDLDALIHKKLSTEVTGVIKKLDSE